MHRLSAVRQRSVPIAGVWRSWVGLDAAKQKQQCGENGGWRTFTSRLVHTIASEVQTTIGNQVAELVVRSRA